MRGVRFKPMFGGYGLYCEEVFFGIIHGEKLYLHTNDESREHYEKAGMTCFITPARKKPLKSYYEIPADILENEKETVRWAREAVASVPPK